jgi:putative hydrolase of the HAD superfamily
MPRDIRAVIFDLGGTLEDVYYDDALRLAATRGLRDILARHALDPGLSIPDLYAVIKTGMREYKTWREENEREIAPECLWSEFVFRDYDLARGRLAAIGEELAFYWDTQFSKRVVRPEARAVLSALCTRGFRLGVISNITSRAMAPCKLAEYGIADFFQVVLTSAEFGWRKPNPRIFRAAARALEVSPAQCAYVGDTVSRDVSGARRAGYGLAIQIKSFLTAQSDRASDVELPDVVIENLMQVVEVVGN